MNSDSGLTGGHADELPFIFVSQVGSYVVEKILMMCDEALFDVVWTDCFKGKLRRLAVHPTANYVVQQLCRACKDREQFGDIAEELCEALDEVWRVQHYGVLVSLSEACARLRSSQEKFKKSLVTALQCNDKKVMLAPCVASQLVLGDYEREVSVLEEMEGAPGDQGRGLARARQCLVKLHGSLILQNMLKFQNTNKIVKSIVAIAASRLVHMVCSSYGSHIIDAFMTSSTVGKKHKEYILNHFQGFYAQFACDKYGSRALDAMWAAASVDQRLMIVDELAGKESVLKSSCYGYFVLKNIGFTQFQRSRDHWTEVQAKTVRMKSMFENMLADKSKK
jgi:nucleolar protein 9